MAPLAFVITRN